MSHQVALALTPRPGAPGPSEARMNRCPQSGKQSYPTADAAWRVLRRQASQRWLHTHKSNGLTGCAYRCEYCHQWHISRQQHPSHHRRALAPRAAMERRP